MSDMDRPCSSAYCAEQACCGGLMCEWHWSQLPPRIRRFVLDKWLAFKLTGADDGHWVAYNTACRHATAALPMASAPPGAYRGQTFPVGRIRPQGGPK